jgi:hypothetical protein
MDEPQVDPSLGDWGARVVIGFSIAHKKAPVIKPRL